MTGSSGPDKPLQGSGDAIACINSALGNPQTDTDTLRCLLRDASAVIERLESSLTARERLLGEAKWVLETLRDVVEEHADPDCEFEESEDFCCHMCEEHGCMARKLAVIDSISPETKNV